MIYILTEDSKDGFDLCSMIARIYHGDSGIKTESYKGIINLKAFLAEFCNTIQDNDTVLLTYDNIIENPLVVRCYSEAYEYLESTGKLGQFTFFPVLSFEFEILMIKGIEYFTDIGAYMEYVCDIRDIFEDNHRIHSSIRILTKYTKENALYSSMYSIIRRDMRKKGTYRNMPDILFESCVTIESLSKKLMSKVFADRYIERPMRNCWKAPCCWKKNRCPKRLIDISKIEEQQDKDPYVKANILICNTSYGKLAESLADGKEILHYDVADFLIEDMDING